MGWVRLQDSVLSLPSVDGWGIALVGPSTNFTKVDNVFLRIWLIGINDPGFSLSRNSVREQICKEQVCRMPACAVMGNKTKSVVHFSQKRFKLSKSLVLLL